MAWVRIPTLDYNDNTEIYIYYGNPCIDAATENPNDVWDSNFVGVWHLKESGSGNPGEFDGSTAFSNDGQGNPTETPTQTSSGKIGTGQDFDGNDFISVPNHSSLQLTSAITLSGWIYLRTFGTGSEVDPIIRKGEVNPNNYQLMVQDGIPQFALDGTDGDALIGATSLNPNTWYYLVGTWESGGSRIVYLNGNQDGSGAFAGPIGTDARVLNIGGRAGADFIDGLLDEVRISDTPRSACWVETEYNNQVWPNTADTPSPLPDPNPGAGFITEGLEETDPPTAVSLISFTATGAGNAVNVKWQTATEFDNLGFHLYRADAPEGPYNRITDKLISARPAAGPRRCLQLFRYAGQLWVSCIITSLKTSMLYGKHTMHGPICVDWDADGCPMTGRCATG